MEGPSSNKRFRDDSDESPESKRFRAELLLDILDDEDTDAGDRDPAVHDLASVMKSFEEEIALPPPDRLDLVESAADQEVLRQHDLGYLLEASDDELGLPPTLPSSDELWEAPVEADAEVEVVGGDAADAAGFGQIWGFNDEIPGCYDGMDFGIRPYGGGEDGLMFDGGIFNYADVLYETSEFSDSAWRSESLPAV